MAIILELGPFLAPPHAEGADADRLWRMRSAPCGETPSPAAAQPLPSIEAARQRLALDVTQDQLRRVADRGHAARRRAELWAGWRRRRPLPPTEPAA